MTKRDFRLFVTQQRNWVFGGIFLLALGQIGRAQSPRTNGLDHSQSGSEEFYAPSEFQNTVKDVLLPQNPARMRLDRLETLSNSSYRIPLDQIKIWAESIEYTRDSYVRERLFLFLVNRIDATKPDSIKGIFLEFARQQKSDKRGERKFERAFFEFMRSFGARNLSDLGDAFFQDQFGKANLQEFVLDSLESERDPELLEVKTKAISHLKDLYLGNGVYDRRMNKLLEDRYIIGASEHIHKPYAPFILDRLRNASKAQNPMDFAPYLRSQNTLTRTKALENIAYAAHWENTPYGEELKALFGSESDILFAEIAKSTPNSDQTEQLGLMQKGLSRLSHNFSDKRAFAKLIDNFLKINRFPDSKFSKSRLGEELFQPLVFTPRTRERSIKWDNLVKTLDSGKRKKLIEAIVPYLTVSSGTSRREAALALRGLVGSFIPANELNQELTRVFPDFDEGKLGLNRSTSDSTNLADFFAAILVLPSISRGKNLDSDFQDTFPEMIKETDLPEIQKKLLQLVNSTNPPISQKN